jgi:type VI secretion system protein ImpL
MTMDGYRQMVLEVESANRHWWTPRFGLNESLEVEAELKAQYCRLFQERFLASFDQGMNEAVIGLGPSAPGVAGGQYIVHLVRRINLLHARLSGSDLAYLQTRPLPPYVFASVDRTIDLETRDRFGDLYLNYLLWRSDADEMNREIADLQVLLRRLFALTGSNLQWLVDWTNREGSVAPIGLGDFWGGTVALADERPILPAYTGKGREMIDTFLDELAAAYPEPGGLERERVSFAKKYREDSFAAWRNFAELFPSGASRLKGAAEWKQVAGTVASDQGACFAFLDRMTSELEPLAGSAGVPRWLEQAYRYRLVKSAGNVAVQSEEQGNKATARLEGLFGGGGETALPETRAAIEALQEYRKSLADISSSSQSRNQAYQMTLQVFSEDQVSGSSPFYAATGAASRFRSGFDGGKADDIFWNIFAGPLDFLWTYARNETSSSIQQQWEETVLQEVQGASNQQAMQHLLSQDGPVWKFVKGPAAPFLGWRAGKGYYSKTALGGSLPFDPAFFTFLAKGSSARIAAPERQDYQVGIRGLPTDANADARTKPQSTRLELQCSSGSQVLENLNFPVSRKFLWSPDACSDVVLRIDVGNLVLTKKYSGAEGFPAFLRSFRGGVHTFRPADFPAEKKSLERLGIRFIKVNYRFTGDGAVTGKAGALPGQAPGTIVRCWE